MATLTKLTASPHSVRYQLDGTPGAVIRTQAQILEDLVAGPLKATIASIETASEWEAFTDSAALQLTGYATTALAADNLVLGFPGSLPQTFRAQFLGTGNVFTIDIRFMPSLVV